MLLKGVRVLDFGRFIAGPYCAALLADLGADVIRIERVAGGEDRCIPRLATTGEGGLYLQMNRNKRCLTLDIASPQGRTIVRKLVATADVVVANMPPATLAQLGLDYETLRTINPRIVATVATAYGEGPYGERVGFDAVGQAMSGAMFISGLPGAPRRALVNYADFGTAQACAMGTLAALMSREKSGRGQKVEGSLLRTGLTLMNSLLIEQAVTGRNRVPQGNRGFTSAPVDVFETRGGWIVVQVVGQVMFERWCDLVGRDDFKSDARMATDEGRGECSAEISAAMTVWCATRTRDSALEELARARLPSAPVYSLQEVLDDPHVDAAQLLPEMGFPGVAPYPLAPHPVKFSELPLSVVRRAPRLGEQSDEILEELGYTLDDIAGFRDSGCV